jgi:uncharacterized membrane protein YwaF
MRDFPEKMYLDLVKILLEEVMARVCSYKLLKNMIVFLLGYNLNLNLINYNIQLLTVGRNQPFDLNQLLFI